MLSMVEVKCPHCGIRGQIMLPPLGAIIVGPCPNCDELVVVFCGRVLPLIKEIMIHGSPQEKHDHLRSVIVDFIDDRVGKVVEQLTPEITEGLHEYTPEVDDYVPPVPEEGQVSDLELKDPPQISVEEVNNFTHFALPLLDNREYFHKIFDLD